MVRSIGRREAADSGESAGRRVGAPPVFVRTSGRSSKRSATAARNRQACIASCVLSSNVDAIPTRACETACISVPGSATMPEPEWIIAISPVDADVINGASRAVCMAAIPTMSAIAARARNVRRSNCAFCFVPICTAFTIPAPGIRHARRVVEGADFGWLRLRGIVDATRFRQGAVVRATLAPQRLEHTNENDESTNDEKVGSAS